MVVLVEAIDAISRRLDRDVMYLRCSCMHSAERAKAKDWLNAAGLSTSDCMPFVTSYLQIESPATELYIDVKYDPNSEVFRLLDSQFRNATGSPVLTGVLLTRLPLEQALLNKEQDEPGYWDKAL